MVSTLPLRHHLANQQSIRSGDTGDAANRTDGSSSRSDRGAWRGLGSLATPHCFAGLKETITAGLQATALVVSLLLSGQENLGVYGGGGGIETSVGGRAGKGW